MKRNRIISGIVIGAICGTAYSAVVILVYVADGFSNRRFEANDTSLAASLIGYVAAGIIGGLTGSALAPVGRHWYGAMLVGPVTVATALATFFLIVDGFQVTIANSSSFIAMVALIIGVPLGLYAWWESQKPVRKSTGCEP
jgi:hypothetical protein